MGNKKDITILPKRPPVAERDNTTVAKIRIKKDPAPPNTTSDFVRGPKGVNIANPYGKPGLENVYPEFQLLAGGVGSSLLKSSTSITGKIGASAVYGANQGAIANVSNVSGSKQDIYGLMGDIVGGAVVGSVLKTAGSTNNLLRNYAPSLAEKIVPARIPKLIRAIEETPVFNSAGRVIVGARDKVQKLLTYGDDKYTLHMTTDRPVSAHKKGDWSGKDYLIDDFDNISSQGDVLSIEPMDTFFETNKTVIGGKKAAYITGNPNKIAELDGKIKILTSDKLKKIYRDGITKLESEYDAADPLTKKLLKSGQKYMDRSFRDEYQKEIQNIINKTYGKTLSKDYSKLEKLTKLNANVEKLTTQPKDVAENLINLKPYKYKNGEFADPEFANLNKRQGYNNVFYDPSPRIHSRIKESLK